MHDDRSAYDEVYVYTMGRSGFILQHVVDAYTVQRADDTSKPMGIVFGLAGVYLRVEKNFTGRQVQNAHRKLGRTKRDWPKIDLPKDRGSMTVLDVLRAPAGSARDSAIDDWCRSVWAACISQRQVIMDLLKEYGVA